MPKRNTDGRRIPAGRAGDRRVPPEYFEGSRKRRPSGLAVFARIAIVLLLAAGVVFRLVQSEVYYVAQISFEEQATSMFVGEELPVTPEIVSFGAGEPVLEWNSSAPSVASVDETGAVKALSAGQTSITVTEPQSGRQAQCSVSVYNIDQMVLGFAETTMGVGEQTALTVQMGAQGIGSPEFASSDESVAAVDASGSITASAPGTAEITVTARGFEAASCSVTVLEAPTVLETVTSGSMCAGETRQLTVSMSDLEYSSVIEYTSDNPSVVSVDAAGVMKAAAKGTATITARAHNGVSCAVPVTVTDEPSSVTVSKKMTVYSGRPVFIGVTDNTEACQEYYYKSSDPEVLRVDEDGTLHVLKRGTATVTCTSYNGKSAECKVTAKIVDYTKPYTSQIVYDNIAALAATYPELIKTSSIGTSVQGRDITLLTLGTGERKVLVASGIHSKESLVVNFTMRCIDEYAKAAAEGDWLGRYDVEKLLSEFTIYFVPLMNPDGMDIAMGIEQPEYTDIPLTEEELSDFKNNANGVNLNRNFPFEWGADGVDTDGPDARSYAGTAAASEPETQALMALCEAHDFEWMFNMHVKGHMIFYQDKVNETSQRSKNMAARLAARCDFVLNDESTVYEISGGFENWFRQKYGNPGLCVEMVESKFSVAVNDSFNRKVQWDVTYGLFLMCLGQ